MKPIFHEKISQAIYGCKSWDEFSRRLACAGIDVKFHDDRNTGEHIGVKFSDGDITMNGSKIDRAFTYRLLNNLFELNRKQGRINRLQPQPSQKLQCNTPCRNHLLSSKMWQRQLSEQWATCSKSDPATILRRQSLSGA